MKFDFCHLRGKKAISVVQPREDENTTQGKGYPVGEEKYPGLPSSSFGRLACETRTTTPEPYLQ